MRYKPPRPSSTLPRPFCIAGFAIYWAGLSGGVSRLCFLLVLKWAGSGSWVRKWIGFVDFGYEGSFAWRDVLAFFGCRRWVGTMGAPERREP